MLSPLHLFSGIENRHTCTNMLPLCLTYLSLCAQVLLSVDLDRQHLGHLQFLDVTSRWGSEAWQPAWGS